MWANYMLEHNINFNTKKTVCMLFTVRKKSVIDHPVICLYNTSLVWDTSFNYLGFNIATGKKHNDNLEIEKRLRKIRIRSNMLATRFSTTSELVKVSVFRTYFSTLYCLGLWIPGTAKMNNSAKVALNNCYRKFFGIRKIVSMSELFVNHGLVTEGVMRRRAVYSLLPRVTDNSNAIIQALYFFIIIY